jgi:hypothetical protein
MVTSRLARCYFGRDSSIETIQQIGQHEFAAEMTFVIQPIAFTIPIREIAGQIIRILTSQDPYTPKGLNEEGNIAISVNPRCISSS